MTNLVNTLAKPTVLVLDCLAGVGTTLQVVQCLATTGAYRIVVASPHRNSILRHSRWVHSCYFLENDINPLQELIQLKEIIRKCNADVLLPVNVDSIDFLIRYGDHELHSIIKLPEQPSLETFRTACSKSLLATFLEIHDIPHPKTIQFIPSDRSNTERIETLQLPLITKPSWGGGGKGMRVFETYDGIIPYLEEASTTENPIIIQEFITGYDLGCAVFCSDGEILSITMQKNISIDQDSLRPSKALQFFDDTMVKDVVAKLMRALIWTGIAQIDLRVNDNTGEVLVLEINPRFWGSLLGSQRMGVNFPDIVCRRALGLPVAPSTYRKGNYINALAYIQYLRDRLLLRPKLEDFTYAESAFNEIVKDPMVRIFEIIQRLTKRS